MHITLLGLPGAYLGNLVSCMEVLTMANQIAAGQGETCRFSWNIATPSGQPVGIAGVTLAPDLAMTEVADTDLIFTPAFIGRIREAMAGREEVCEWLQHSQKRGIAIATSCTGSFLLARAGLLDGCRAATNWLFAEPFRKLFPKVDLDEDALVVLDHGVYTTGATMALYHLLLHFIEQEYGFGIARKTGGLLLIDANRVSQAPYRRGLLLRPHSDPDIRKVENWLERNWNSQATTADMADLASLSERQFLRRFKAATGKTPIGYLQNIRIEQARNLLEMTSLPIGEITWSVGYEDVNTFRKLFRRLVGVSPSQYRQRFSGSWSS